MFTIFDKLGGAEAALDIIASETGVKPTSESLRNWRRAKRIPGNKAVYLLDRCIERGIPVLWRHDCVLAGRNSEVAE